MTTPSNPDAMMMALLAVERALQITCCGSDEDDERPHGVQVVSQLDQAIVALEAAELRLHRGEHVEIGDDYEKWLGFLRQYVRALEKRGRTK